MNQLRFGDVTTNSGSTLAYWDRISVFNSASDPEPGDINADCKVDIADLLLLQRRILGY